MRRAKTTLWALVCGDDAVRQELTWYRLHLAHEVCYQKYVADSRYRSRTSGLERSVVSATSRQATYSCRFHSASLGSTGPSTSALHSFCLAQQPLPFVFTTQNYEFGMFNRSSPSQLQSQMCTVEFRPASSTTTWPTLTEQSPATQKK